MRTPTYFNDWFLALPKERQAILREDKWMMADNAFEAGMNEARKKHPHQQGISLEDLTPGERARLADLIEAQLADALQDMIAYCNAPAGSMAYPGTKAAEALKIADKPVFRTPSKEEES